MQLSFSKDGSVEKVAELTVAVFQGGHQLGKVQSLIDPDQQVIGIDEIPQLPGGDLEPGGIPAGPIQRCDHRRPRL